MDTATKNERVVRALTKLIYFYWEWADLSLKDVQDRKHRKVTELAYTKLVGFCEAMYVLFGLGTPTRVELDMRDFYLDNPPPARNFGSSVFAGQRDVWIAVFVHHLYEKWNLKDGLS